jgi:hypothetical protein
MPQNRCNGFVVNAATPPAYRAQKANAAISQTRGNRGTDCHLSTQRAFTF